MVVVDPLMLTDLFFVRLFVTFYTIFLFQILVCLFNLDGVDGLRLWVHLNLRSNNDDTFFVRCVFTLELEFFGFSFLTLVLSLRLHHLVDACKGDWFISKVFLQPLEFLIVDQNVDWESTLNTNLLTVLDQSSKSFIFAVGSENHAFDWLNRLFTFREFHFVLTWFNLYKYGMKLHYNVRKIIRNQHKISFQIIFVTLANRTQELKYYNLIKAIT